MSSSLYECPRRKASKLDLRNLRSWVRRCARGMKIAPVIWRFFWGKQNASVYCMTSSTRCGGFVDFEACGCDRSLARIGRCMRMKASLASESLGKGIRFGHVAFLRNVCSWSLPVMSMEKTTQSTASSEQWSEPAVLLIGWLHNILTRWEIGRLWTSVERSSGCLHVTCRCGTEFCYD